MSTATSEISPRPTVVKAVRPYMRADDVKRLIARKYCAPSHSTFFEVADATGARHSGWADAISMSLWPSHGMHIDGFEVKVSKYDWQKELANPSKAEKFAARCDRWWIVATEGVIDDVADVPGRWGYMLATPEKLTIIKHAEINSTPLPLDRVFMASMLRSADKVSDAILTAAVEARVMQLREGDEDRVRREIELRTRNNQDASKILEAVTSKIKTTDWEWLRSDELVAAIVAVYRIGAARSYDGIFGAIKAAEDAAVAMREASEALGIDVPIREKPKRKKAGSAAN